MTSPIPTPTGSAPLEFSVDGARCIGCIACVNVFPNIFKMDGERASAFAAEAGAVSASRVLQSCPVGAIQRVAPAQDPQAVTALEIVPGWEKEWEAHRREPEDLLERQRRYGRVFALHEIGGCFVLRIELPRELPRHELFYMHGIPMGPPEYDCTLQHVGPWTISIRAHLLDPRLRFLSGKLNSFPPGLKVDFRFPRPVGEVFHRMDLRDLWVYALPEGTQDPTATLAAAVRDHLAAR
jgi:ferredoxin